MKTDKKQQLRQLRVWRIRKTVNGTSLRPRMSATFTGQNIYVQFIDDENRLTLVSTSTRQKRSHDFKFGANIKSAVVIGKEAAELAISKGVTQVVFDRRGARYHGKVKALADAAREAGLKF
jgi:large subunit ribosomal protein L18